MKHLPATIATLLATWIALPAFAAPEATVLFAQPGTQIISPTGVSRPVKKGDVVQTGERLVTPPGGISQIKLLDGSLVGLRPDSELKIALPPAASDKGVQVVSLTKGAARVVGAELMDDKKPSRFTLQSGLATLQLKGADLESSIVPATGPNPVVGGDAGSYNRMLVGTGTIGNSGGTGGTALLPREVNYVGPNIGSPPLVLASMPYSPSTYNSKAGPTSPALADRPPTQMLPTSQPIGPTSIKPVQPTVTTAFPQPVKPPVFVAPPVLYTPPRIYIPPPPVTIVRTCSFTKTGQRICI
jgi:hypothetical protein